MTSAAATSYAPVFVAAAEAAPRNAIVSVHDVAPATWKASARIVDELKQLGARVCSLLVVPDYHHAGRSTDDAAFVRWLRDCEGDGHEVVVHGYYHERPRRAEESLSEKLVTQFYTSDEGEFYDLPYPEALARVTRAAEEFRAAKLKPHGFIAPAWLLGHEAERAICDAGFEYTTRLTAIRDLRAAQDVHARSLVYSVRSSWRRAASLAWNAALAERLKMAEVVRLGLHPPDIEHPKIWSQVRRIVRDLAQAREFTTYREWLAKQRLRSEI